MYTFRGNIAEKFGINAAVVAEYLYAGERVVSIEVKVVLEDG